MAQPVMRISLVLSPPIFSLGESCSLIITATLEYSEAVTIYTWPTIFNLPLAQKRHNFFCIDLSDNDKAINLNVENAGKRANIISRQLGSYDDRFLVTFHPDTPVSFTDEFILAARPDRPLKPGHRYRFGLNRPFLSWTWLHGTRGDIMTTEKEYFRGEWQSEVEVPPGDVVEFVVKE